MAPVRFQLEFFDCPSKNGEKTRLSSYVVFSLWTVNDRSCHSVAEQKTMSKVINLLFTEPINCTKNPISRFEMVAVVLCWNSVAVDFIPY